MAFTIPEIEDALRANGGLLTSAASSLTRNSPTGQRITRQGLKKRIKNSARLQAVLPEIDEALKDLAEANIFKLIKAGDRHTSIWYLGTKARDRGYGQQLGVSAGFDDQGRPVALSASPSVMIYIPDNGRDPQLIVAGPQRILNGRQPASGNGDAIEHEPSGANP
jgi:hypothetical protein